MLNASDGDDSLGLKRNTVALAAHRNDWAASAEKAIAKLKQILGDVAIDIQHIGSTAVPSIHAKPILDIVVGVSDLATMLPCYDSMQENGFIFRGEDVFDQLLFVCGDFENDIRTHHVHVVEYGGSKWNDYLAFRDYLRAFPRKAASYEACKIELAARFPNDRKSYTEGKEAMVGRLLKEAAAWQAKQQR